MKDINEIEVIDEEIVNPETKQMKVLLANELRIGNLLYNDNVIVKIDARSIFDIWDDKGIKTYKPIPLTEEFLLKFGFEFESKDEYTGLTYYEIKYVNSINQTNIISIDSDKLVQITEEDDKINYINLCTIKYVHELQNIYFCLCGKELTLNKTNDK